MTTETPSGDAPPPARTAQHQYACKSCGAALEFAPGTTSMKCPYCGAQTAITPAGTSEKIDYASYAARPHTPLAQLGPFTVACTNCGATQTTTAVSGRCTSCKGAVVVTDDLGGELKSPDGIVPFVVDKARADKEFKEWAGSRWFAPNALKKVVRTDSMTGSYLPHWGFDDKTTSDYQGERGEHYWDTETYTVNENGHMETRTREVQKTRWFPASGRVARDFVDVVATGVTAPDEHLLKKLGPWTTEGATSYESEYLAGFETPRYTVPADAGFEDAKDQMAEQIRSDCKDDIGGDEQRVHRVHTIDADVLFRLLLMPLWIATYLFAGKTYHVYVNANTGEVIGERPYSAVKIVLAVIAALVVIAGALVIYKLSSG